MIHARELSGRPPEPVSFTDQDERLAMEIAEFVAERAQAFSDSECRAWALTDFGVWAVLAGQSPKLSMHRERRGHLH